MGISGERLDEGVANETIWAAAGGEADEDGELDGLRSLSMLPRRPARKFVFLGACLRCCCCGDMVACKYIDMYRRNIGRRERVSRSLEWKRCVNLLNDSRMSQRAETRRDRELRTPNGQGS